MLPSDLHSYTEAYSFTLNSGGGYPMPPLQFSANDTAPSSYQYHTFAMEWLPHEVRILIDSVVVRRLPDRLIPAGSPYFDWITTMPRGIVDIRPAEIDIDPPGDGSDPFGSDTTGQWNGNYTSGTHRERLSFEHALSIPGWPGIWDSAAHHRIDYIKVWDVPKDVKIPNFPQ